MTRPTDGPPLASSTRPVTLDELLRANLRHPEAPALGPPDGLVRSYGELCAAIEALAAQLASRGLGRGSRVAVVLPNGADMALAFLTVASCATCAPLNPGYTKAEFDFYLSDLHAQAVLTQAGFAPAVRSAAAERSIPILELDALTVPPAAAPRIEWNRADDVVLILHTSGTTARPKIVPLGNGQLCASAASIAGTLRLTAADRCLNVMPLFHIHGLVGALLSTMAAGGSILCTAGMEPAGFFRVLEEARCTWYTAVPTIHQAVLRAAPEHAERIARAQLRFIRSSSASLPPVVMQRLEDVFHAPVLEAYGMTEAAHQMASNPLPPAPRKPGAVGVAAGPEIAILDQTGRLLERGQRGEIAIRGASVFRGYEANPDANAKAFHGDWFRTGDEGYFDPDGYLFLSGRLKELINRAGEKIAPREVDEALLAHPAVAQAATFAVPHPTLGEDVAAAVVLKAGTTAGAEALRQFALERLAEHKVPRQILILDDIPKGATGKIQRIGLAAQLASRLKAPFEEPRTQTERLLADIWKGVLGLETVGIHDNFFNAGGDSIQSMLVIARARSAGIEISPRQFVDHPTISSVAPLAVSTVLARVDEETVTGPSPLLPMQDYLLSLESSPPLVFSLDAQRPLDHSLLEATFSQLLRYHDALRAELSDDGGWRQTIRPPSDRATVTHIDLRGVPAAAQETALFASLEEMGRTTGAGKGAMAAFAHLELDDGETGVVAVVNHLATDGYSQGILADDFRTLYDQLSRGETPTLPRKTTSMKRWAEDNWARLRNGEFAAEVPYWQSVVAGTRPLPVDHREGPTVVETVFKELDVASSHAALVRAPAAYEVTTLDLLVTALDRTLRAWCGGPTPIEIVFSGRAGEGTLDLSRTVGPLFGVAPVLAPHTPGAAARDQARAVAHHLRAVPSDGLHFPWLARFGDANLRAGIGQGVVLNYGVAVAPVETASPLGVRLNSRVFKLVYVALRRFYASDTTCRFIVQRRGDHLDLTIRYSTALYRQSTMLRLLERFADDLRQLAA